jgi:Flp pilus assembly pilin Flp
MIARIVRFLREEKGQDLTEYTLLIVFVLLAILGLASGYHNNIAGIVSITNTNLATANTAAS